MENKFSDELRSRNLKSRVFSENQLIIQLETMQQNISAFVSESNRRLDKLEKSQQDDETKSAVYERQIQDLKDHISRMENGLQLDFKTTQDILKARLEHEMNIERARLDFQQKLEEKEAAIKNQQRAIRNDLLLKLGGIALPIVVAATTLITKWLEGLF